MLRLTGGKEYRHPFPLILWRRVWDDYAGLLARLPGDEFYVRNDQGGHCGAGRSSFSLVPRNLDRLPENSRLFWSGVRDALHGPHLRDYLTSRLGVSAQALFPFATLVRDNVGHAIGIHPDWDRKVITLQAYLPSDDSQRGEGTQIFDAERRWVRTLPFLPGTAYAFARSDASFHALSPVVKGPRNSLMLTYYREEHDEY